mmetsp:Transcript_28300/g.76668  ORF Transcript_28300/g.76668 Transcript_28300/m.76668 type:complete len:203 (+) Transcript_28300:225-833(+)
MGRRTGSQPPRLVTDLGGAHPGPGGFGRNALQHHAAAKEVDAIGDRVGGPGCRHVAVPETLRDRRGLWPDLGHKIGGVHVLSPHRGVPADQQIRVGAREVSGLAVVVSFPGLEPIEVPASTQNHSIVLVRRVLEGGSVETLPDVDDRVGGDRQIEVEDFLPDDWGFLKVGDDLEKTGFEVLVEFHRFVHAVGFHPLNNGRIF